MRFGIVGNLEKKELPRVLRELLTRVHAGKADFLVVRELARAMDGNVRKALKAARVVSEKELLKESDLILALGGDGTILRTARFVGQRQIPILGINLGKLGFLAEISLDEVESCLEDILSGRYVVEERMMLEARTASSRHSFVSLNDIVIDKHGTSRVMGIEAHVNEEYLATYSADGIIISTPTGSTAYSLANGGPIVAPTSRAVTISPICPHTLTARPVIVPDDSVITIRIAAVPHKVRLTADGQLEQLFGTPISIKIRQAPFKAKLVKRLHTSYYDVLRKKLNWGSDVRIKSKN